MRVITGTAGGLSLQIPKGVDIRPTQDKVRSAIFSALGDRVLKARVLDLFAGSGSYGIEALSRGAQEAVFVENNRRCFAALQKNLLFTKLNTSARCVLQDVFDFLKQPGNPYDLIFADPPYLKNVSRDETQKFYQKFLQTVAPHLAKEGWLALEYFYHHPPLSLKPFETIKTKKYGETGVLFLGFPKSAIA